MFRKDREYNIISGEKVNFVSQRSISCAQKRDYFHNQQQPAFKTTKLGLTRDRKMYQYDYTSDVPTQGVRSLTQQDSKSNFLPSMVNYASTNYNIITHKQQFSTSKVVGSAAFSSKIPEVNRKNPLTKLIHAGRLVAPNYHPDYEQRQAKGEFIRKRNLCGQICDVEKGYQLGKYFRKLK